MKRPYILAFLWIAYLAVIGPWLISAESTFAVLTGIAIAMALLFLSNHWLKKPLTKDPPR